MKIAMVGCGALGSYYGASLSRAGNDVHFLMRGDLEVAKRDGIRILSEAGDFTVHPPCASRPEEIGVCDLVIIGLKTTANDQFPKLLPSMVRSHTALLTLQNGLGNEECLAATFLPEQILGGLCFVCLNRIAPAVVKHIAFGKIVVGEFSGPPKTRTHQIAVMFREALVPSEVTLDLRRAHWEKLVWNIPFNGLGVASAAGVAALESACLPESPGEMLPTDRLLADRHWEKIVRELMQEIIAAANALGLKVDPSLGDRQIERTRKMGEYKASTLIDFERGFSLELESMFLEPFRQAQLAGVDTPWLARLCRLLTAMEKRQVLIGSGQSPYPVPTI